MTKYELQTSSYDCKASQWSFAGSNDKTTWKNKEEKSYNMGNEEIYPFDWNYGPYKCFQLLAIKSQCSSEKYHDIRQIEIFGTYYPKGEPKNSCSKHSVINFTLNFIIIFIVS